MRRAGRPAASGRLQGLRDQRKRTESVSPPSSSPDRPSPKRLPGGRAFNLGRSVLGALGNLLPDLAGVKHPFATMCRKVRQSCFSWDSLEKFGPRKTHRGGGSLVRPPNRPPPKRLPVGGPSTSGAPSSVQSGHYGAVHAPSSRNRSQIRSLRIFLYKQHNIASRRLCSD